MSSTIIDRVNRILQEDPIGLSAAAQRTLFGHVIHDRERSRHLLCGTYATQTKRIAKRCRVARRDHAELARPEGNQQSVQ